MESINSFFLAIALFFSSLFSHPTPHITPTTSDYPSNEISHVGETHNDSHSKSDISLSEVGTPATNVTVSGKASSTKSAAVVAGQRVYMYEELLSFADNKYKNGEVPLGDGKYMTSAPKQGYIYLCNARSENFGSMKDGPWVHGTTWNFLEKLAVAGSVSWPTATFSNIVSGAYRILSGNGLPTDHTTGTFPIASTDPVYQYDRNPGTIKETATKNNLPKDPVYQEQPYCMGGEAGIMLNGVALFNGFDAPLRDAPAHEVQDHCDGHPQDKGLYHYHSMSKCIKDLSVTKVLGYALDGFPITGPQVAKDKYLTTEDLDVCHGLTSEIEVDGEKKITYHYVLTQDFPYSVSCFRSKPTKTGGQATQTTSNQGVQTNQQGGMSQPQAGAPSNGNNPPTPPQEAQDACKGLKAGSTCSVGEQMTGTCQMRSVFACFPR